MELFSPPKNASVTEKSEDAVEWWSRGLGVLTGLGAFAWGILGLVFGGLYFASGTLANLLPLGMSLTFLGFGYCWLSASQAFSVGARSRWKWFSVPFLGAVLIAALRVFRSLASGS